MEMFSDLWGIPPEQEGLFGQDFFYGAWLYDLRNLLNLDAIQRDITVLSALPKLNKKQKKDLETRRAQLKARQIVLDTIRPSWRDWLMDAPPHAHCQWCSRPTRYWVSHKPRTLTFKTLGNSFVESAVWRQPSDGSGFCPSCGLMVLSQSPQAEAFKGVKTDAKILRTASGQFRVVAVGGGLWWEWPWDQAPALWTHVGKGALTWSKRYWVHQTQPAWSSTSVPVWFKGNRHTFSGEALQALVADAQQQVALLHEAWEAGMPDQDLEALSKGYSQTAQRRWAELTHMVSQDGWFGECFWIPTITNLQKHWETALPSQAATSDSLNPSTILTTIS